MRLKRVFVSYDYENDRHYKELLLAWGKNSLFDFNFSDESADVSIQSTDPSKIKQAISAKINRSDTFLCIVGENTHKSDWVVWEIGKALELRKKIVAVKTEKEFQTPNNLFNVGARWALSFNFDDIKNAIEGY